MLRVDRELTVAFVATFAMILNVGIMIIAMQIIFFDVVSDFEIALISTVYWIPIFLLTSIWGYVADVTGERKRLVITTQLIVSFLTYLHMVFSSYHQILILRFLTGIFSSAYLPCVQGYLTLDKKPEEFGHVLGVYNTAVAFGFFVSGILSSVCLYFVEPLELIIFAGLASLMSSMLLILLPSKPRIRREEPPSKMFSSLASIRLIGELRRGKAYFLVLSLAIRHLAIMGIFSVVYVYMQRVGIDRVCVGYVSAMNSFVQTTLIHPLSRLSDRIGRKKLFVSGFLLSSFIPITLMFARTLIDFILAFIVIGTAYSTMIAGANPYLRDVAPKSKISEILSLTNTTRAFGMIFGPILVGFLVTHHSYTLAFSVLFILGLISTFLSLFTEEIYQKEYIINQRN